MQQKPTSNRCIKTIQQYQLMKVIGRGSFATVYLAQKDQQQFAIKEMDITQNVIQDGRLELFTREIEILQQLDHKNIVKLYERIETNDYLYLVFEYCSQGDMENYLKNTHQSKLPEQKAKIIFVQIVTALNELKRLKIVHRDLKLANILMADGLTIKLADFGFARFMPQGNALLESYCGTPLTMAPEILKNQVKYTDKCDMWSLGVILYQILYGTSPFKPKPGGGVEELIHLISTTQLQFPTNVQISPSLKLLLQQLLQVNPSQRLSIEEVIKSEWIKQESIEKQERDTVPTLKKVYSDSQTTYVNELAGHTKYLIQELSLFTKHLKSLLEGENYYHNEIVKSAIQNLQQQNYQITLRINSLTLIQVKTNQSNIDSLLYTMSLELYTKLISLPKVEQIQCFKIIQIIVSYINNGKGLKSSLLQLGVQNISQSDLIILKQAISDENFQAKQSEKILIVQEFQPIASDWALFQEMITNRYLLLVQSLGLE